MTLRSAACRRTALALALAVVALPALAGPVSLAPELPGQYQAGSGVDAVFLKVQDSWQQSSVLWNEATQKYGSGMPVSGYNWGTGLWGLADWHTANDAPTPGMIEGSWSGRVSQIAFGDDSYNIKYGATWGTVDIAPLFGGPTLLPSQDNWTSSFSGFIRISEAGLYNFSVLHDDGFFFKLYGAGNDMLEISNDFLNARERIGFDNNLRLSAGLYAFELGGYDRLEAGVVELSWSRDGGAWSRVPTANLLARADVTPVPEPASALLVLTGLTTMTLMALRRRRRS